jgi:hypothetical protein
MIRNFGSLTGYAFLDATSARPDRRAEKRIKGPAGIF